MLVYIMQIRLSYIHSCHRILSYILVSHEEPDLALVKRICPVSPHTAPRELHGVQSDPAAQSGAAEAAGSDWGLAKTIYFFTWRLTRCAR